MNAGPHLRSRGVAQAGRTATAVRPAHQADRADCRWLMLAAETAGLIRGNGRASPDAWPAGRGDLPRIATRAPGTDAGSVRAARDFTLATLHRWDAAERGEDIAIVVTELLSNALRHALPSPGDPPPRRPVRLGLLQPGSCVLCAVADPSRTVPVPQGPGSLTETGRGLQIIRALSDIWGYTVLGDAGKVVWAAFIPPSLAQARVSVGRWARRGWS
jgi:Histidine kinase-like ATPase domain